MSENLRHRNLVKHANSSVVETLLLFCKLQYGNILVVSMQAN